MVPLPENTGNQLAPLSKSPLISLSEAHYDKSFPEPSPRTLAAVTEAEQICRGVPISASGAAQDAAPDLDPFVLPQIGGGRCQPMPAPEQTPSKLRPHIKPTERAKDSKIIAKSNANRAELVSAALSTAQPNDGAGRASSYSASPAPFNAPLPPSADTRLSPHPHPAPPSAYPYGASSFLQAPYGQPGHLVYGRPPEQGQLPQNAQYGHQNPAPSGYTQGQMASIAQGFPLPYGPYGTYAYGGHPPGVHNQLMAQPNPSAVDPHQIPTHLIPNFLSFAPSGNIHRPSRVLSEASCTPSEIPHTPSDVLPVPSEASPVPTLSDAPAASLGASHVKRTQRSNTFDAFLKAGEFQTLTIPDGPVLSAAPSSPNPSTTVHIIPPTPADIGSNGTSKSYTHPPAEPPVVIDDIFGDGEDIFSATEPRDNDSNDEEGNTGGESPIMGRLSKEKRAALEDGFQQLDKVAQRTSEATGLSVMQIIKRWNTATTHVKSSWNIYQQYFKQKRDQEIRRLPESNTSVAVA